MSQWKVFASLALMSSSLMACSNNQFLSSMNVNVTTQNQQSFVNLSAEVNLGNAVLSSIQIPIYDPHTKLQLGQVSFGPSATGKEVITVSLDASSVLHADPTLGSTLPNGLPLPSVVAPTTGQMLAIPVLNYSRVYIGGDLKNNIVIGAALAIQGLDSVMSAVPIASNLFFAQSFNANLSGVAGIFGGAGAANQSGIAVFAKFTPATPLNIALAPVGPVVMSHLKTQSIGPSMSVSASGVTPKKKGNQLINENVDPQTQKDLLNYFYGESQVLTPQ